jgi:transcriptional regulator with XRE-family HTH domain
VAEWRKHVSPEQWEPVRAQMNAAIDKLMAGRARGGVKDFAAYAGLSAHMITQLRNGRIPPPPQPRLLEITNALRAIEAGEPVPSGPRKPNEFTKAPPEELEGLRARVEAYRAQHNYSIGKCAEKLNLHDATLRKFLLTKAGLIPKTANRLRAALAKRTGAAPEPSVALVPRQRELALNGIPPTTREKVLHITARLDTEASKASVAEAVVHLDNLFAKFGQEAIETLLLLRKTLNREG